MRRREDDHHPRRSVHADQHGRHPPLGLEQRLAPRRTQSQVPVLPAAAQHHRLSEVSNESNAPSAECAVIDLLFCLLLHHSSSPAMIK